MYILTFIKALAQVQDRLSHVSSARGARNSHINLKRKKICTVEFYEDPTVYIIHGLYYSKYSYRIKKFISHKKIHIGLELYHAWYTARIKKIRKDHIINTY